MSDEQKVEDREFTEEEQMEIVRAFPIGIVVFDNPSVQVQSVAYEGNKEVIKLLKNPHPSLTLMDM